MADAIVTVKTCRKCGAEFSTRQCKICKKAYMVAWYASNPTKVKAYRDDRRASNPEEHRAEVALYRANNADKIRASRAAHYDPQKNKKRGAIYRAANGSKVRSQKAEYAEANSKKIVAKVAAWRKEHPDAHRVASHNRRAKLRENGGRLSRGLAAKLFTLQRGKCACCALPLGDDYQMDHTMPIALGGSNTDDNIQLLRRRCNSQKNAKDPVRFMQERGFLL